MNRWSVDFHARTPLTEQLYVQLRREIEEGVLEPGTRLPSRRRLAEMAGVSATTAEGALGRLLEEGYALSRPKSGLYVNAVQPRPRIETAARTEIRWNFGTGVMDASQFPYSVWAKRMREVLSEQKEELLSSGDSRGSLGLRQEIAGVLRRLRGIYRDCRSDYQASPAYTPRDKMFMGLVPVSPRLYAFMTRLKKIYFNRTDKKQKAAWHAA